MVRLLRLLPFLVVCACTTLQGKANELAERGRYIEASEIYDQLIRERPTDESLVNARDDLRWKALEQLLGRARRHRFDGNDDEAEHFLERFLARRSQWNTKLDGALESSLEDEFEATYLHLRRVILQPAQQGLALTAEQPLHQKRALLAHPELGKVRRELEGAILQGGKATCARLKQTPTAGAPHWMELVARYCRRYQESAPQPPPLPEVVTVPAWSGSVDGVSAAQREQLQARLSQVFEASPWYSPAATRQAGFTLRGHFTERREQQTVRLTAPWTDRVPYTDHEERTETIEEPYEEEEEYTDETGKKQKRKVTRTRTRTRSYTVPVTKYREVHKAFDYSAQRHALTYGFSVSATGVLVEQRGPLTAAHTDQLSLHGFEHDVSFPPGNVSPQRPDFPPPHGWFGQNVAQLEKTFAGQLREHWHQAYCAVPGLTLEEAARCARVGTELPAHASQRLAEVLGADGPRVPVLFAGP